MPEPLGAGGRAAISEQAFGLDHSWRNSIYTNSARSENRSEVLDESLDCSLGRGVSAGAARAVHRIGRVGDRAQGTAGEQGPEALERNARAAAAAVGNGLRQHPGRHLTRSQDGPPPSPLRD